MMDPNALFRAHAGSLEDFWGRRQDTPRQRRSVEVFGRQVHLESHQAGVLAAVDHSLPLFSQVPAVVLPACTVQVAVRPAREDPGPPPADLMDRIWYTGQDQWLMMHLGPWGHAHVDLVRGQAAVVLAPALAARPALVSHCVLNTILLNFCLGSGYGMLHASCLVRDRRALLLMAPHNSGKSTTALHLVMAGYSLVTDSMVHVVPTPGRLLLAGFPVGRIKLRADVLPRFPELAPLLEAERVRDETKYALALDRLGPARSVASAVAPERLELCLLHRSDRDRTVLTPASEAETWAAIMHNSLFYDEPAAWEVNLTQVARVVARARAHHLHIGRDPDGIVAAVDALWGA